MQTSTRKQCCHPRVSRAVGIGWLLERRRSKHHAFPAAILLCAAIAHAPTTARSAESSFFVSAGIGQSSTARQNFFDAYKDTGTQIDFGYRWAVGNSASLGVEGGYADLGEFSGDTAADRASVKLHGPTFGANARFEVAPNWYFGARAGYWREDYVTHLATSFETFNGSRDTWYSGVSVGHDFTHNVSLGITYDYFNFPKTGQLVQPRLFGVNGEYRF